MPNRKPDPRFPPSASSLLRAKQQQAVERRLAGVNVKTGRPHRDLPLGENSAAFRDAADFIRRAL